MRLLVAPAFEKALALVRECEGLRLTTYLDVAKIKTVGYGHVWVDGDPEVITSEVAEVLLANDARRFFTAVVATPRPHDKPLNENQLAALTSFVYNVGIAAYRGDGKKKKPSGVFQALTIGDDARAVNELRRWTNASLNGKRVRIQGLSNRRAREVALFTKPIF